MLCSSVQWKWEKQENYAFKASKDLLLSSQILVHFDPVHPIVLACDTFAHRVGAVLSHKFADGLIRETNWFCISNTHRYREEILTSRKRRSSMYFRTVTFLHLLVWS